MQYACNHAWRSWRPWNARCAAWNGGDCHGLDAHAGGAPSRMKLMQANRPVRAIPPRTAAIPLAALLASGLDDGAMFEGAPEESFPRFTVEAVPIFAEDKDFFETAIFQTGTPPDSACGEDASPWQAAEGRFAACPLRLNITAPSGSRACNILFVKRVLRQLMRLCRLHALPCSPISSKIRDNHLGAGRTSLSLKTGAAGCQKRLAARVSSSTRF